MNREIRKMKRELEKYMGQKPSAEQVWLALVEENLLPESPEARQMVQNILGE